MTLPTWGLLIGTYNRRDPLCRCIAAALAQSAPPSEIIIVDASDDWTLTRDLVQRQCAASAPHVRLVYERAHQRSSAAQRNQAVAHSMADIVFLIDDDTFLHAGAAQTVLRIYQADTQRQIGAISLCEAGPEPPEPSDSGTNNAPTSSPRATPSPLQRIRRSLRRLIHEPFRIEQILVPYDDAFPPQVVPPVVSDMNVASVVFVGGCYFTARREVMRQTPFEQVLVRYTAGEDLDASYRISQRWTLLKAFDARCYHAKAGGGRLSRRAVATLWLANLTALHCLNSTNRARSRRRLGRAMRKRLCFNLLRDLARARWSLPETLGTCDAMRLSRRLYALSPQQVRQIYPQVQASIADGKALPPWPRPDRS